MTIIYMRFMILKEIVLNILVKKKNADVQSHKLCG